MKSIFTSKLTKQMNALDVLIDSNPTQMDETQRTNLTVSCSDTAYIPKVRDAGRVVTENGLRLQVMHNGIKVIAGGYYGDLIENIIKKLKGHHEPQEEKAFFEVLKRIDSKVPTMIELGSFWAYYSLWFKKEFSNSTVICCEPDPKNLEVGKRNMHLNGYNEKNGVIFSQTAAGSKDGKVISFNLDSEPGKVTKAAISSVDSLCARDSIQKLDLLHIDTQGAELGALKGAIETIKNKKLRFVVVSTHHYIFSGDPLTHQKCEDFIITNGGHIVTSHNVLESFSGDGLIVASFDDRDNGFRVDVSVNTGKSLFRPYEQDIAVLVEAFEKRNA